MENERVTTPQAAYRAKVAADAEKQKQESKVIKEWVEVVKRSPQEDGKVIYKTVKSNGHEYSEYVGRESKCKDWLAEQIQLGTYKPKSFK
jgi:hypothetical protein